jgi:hypothetical protein
MRMKRRIWPDVVIVIAVLAIGSAGVWTLWGDKWRTKDRVHKAPETTAGTPQT